MRRRALRRAVCRLVASRGGILGARTSGRLLEGLEQRALAHVVRQRAGAVGRPGEPRRERDGPAEGRVVGGGAARHLLQGRERPSHPPVVGERVVGGRGPWGEHGLRSGGCRARKI